MVVVVAVRLALYRVAAIALLIIVCLYVNRLENAYTPPTVWWHLFSSMLDVSYAMLDYAALARRW